MRLCDLAQIQSGGTPPRENPELFVGDIPWVKTLDLNEGRVTTTDEHISIQGLQTIRGKVRPVNTVMVAMYGGAGTVGKAGILGIPAATNQAVCCIETDQKLLEASYLLHFLVYYRPNWMKYAVGTRKDPNIGKGIVERLLVPVPSLDVQNSISRVLNAVDAKLLTEQKLHRALSDVFQTLLDVLIPGKVRLNAKADPPLQQPPFC